mgnify:CR=1 FL=1
MAEPGKGGCSFVWTPEMRAYIKAQNKLSKSLSLGYMAGNNINSMEFPKNDPFGFQNDFIYNACGVDGVFRIYGSIMGEKVEFTAESSGRMLVYITTDIEKCSVVIERDGTRIFQKDYSGIESPQIIDCQDCLEGDVVTVYCSDQDAGSITVYPAVMDYEKYYEAMDLLSSLQLDITRMEDTLIEGQIDAGFGGVLFTTIPYDEGWSIYVDGEKTQFTGFGDSFITVDLEPGIHEVMFSYWPEGLTAGIIISLSSLVGFVLSCLILYRKKRLAERW